MEVVEIRLCEDGRVQHRWSNSENFHAHNTARWYEMDGKFVLVIDGYGYPQNWDSGYVRCVGEKFSTIIEVRTARDGGITYEEAMQMAIIGETKVHKVERKL